jgi:hypothetical protein
MTERQELLAALDAARTAAARLPVCDGATRLHALLTRIRPAAESSALAASASELARAAAAALDDDPWVQFEVAVRRLRDLAFAAGTVPGDHTSAA